MSNDSPKPATCPTCGHMWRSHNEHGCCWDDDCECDAPAPDATPTSDAPPSDWIIELIQRHELRGEGYEDATIARLARALLAAREQLAAERKAHEETRLIQGAAVRETCRLHDMDIANLAKAEAERDTAIAQRDEAKQELATLQSRVDDYEMLEQGCDDPQCECQEDSVCRLRDTIGDLRRQLDEALSECEEWNRKYECAEADRVAHARRLGLVTPRCKNCGETKPLMGVDETRPPYADIICCRGDAQEGGRDGE